MSKKGPFMVFSLIIPPSFHYIILFIVLGKYLLLFLLFHDMKDAISFSVLYPLCSSGNPAVMDCSLATLHASKCNWQLCSSNHSQPHHSTSQPSWIYTVLPTYLSYPPAFLLTWPPTIPLLFILWITSASNIIKLLIKWV